MVGIDRQAPPLIVRRAVADDVSGIARVHVRSWQIAHRGHVPHAVLDSLDEAKRASRWGELLEAPGHALQVAVCQGAMHPVAMSPVAMSPVAVSQGELLQGAVLHDAAVRSDAPQTATALYDNGAPHEGRDGPPAGTVVGFCSLIPTRDTDAESATGEVAALYVSPERLRSGVGQALLQACIDAARLRRYRAITLWVMTANVAARCFYEKLGFVLDGACRVEERGSYSLTEVRYRLELPAPSERR